MVELFGGLEIFSFVWIKMMFRTFLLFWEGKEVFNWIFCTQKFSEMNCELSKFLDSSMIIMD